MKRFFLFSALVAMIGTCLAFGNRPAADSLQNGMQTLIVHYPNPKINIASSGNPPKYYAGLIYVKIFAVGAGGVQSGQKPVATAELGPSARTVRQLPLGDYEVWYEMRDGSTLKTFIMRDVILRADGGQALSVEMNGEAATTIIGGEMTAKEMADSIRDLRAQVSSLKEEVAKLKK
jgi:hypothetical protein